MQTIEKDSKMVTAWKIKYLIEYMESIMIIKR